MTRCKYGLNRRYAVSNPAGSGDFGAPFARSEKPSAQGRLVAYRQRPSWFDSQVPICRVTLTRVHPLRRAVCVGGQMPEVHLCCLPSSQFFQGCFHLFQASVLAGIDGLEVIRAVQDSNLQHDFGLKAVSRIQVQ